MDQQWKGNALFLFHGTTCHDFMLCTVTYLVQQYTEKALLPFHDKMFARTRRKVTLYVNFVLYCTFSHFKVSCYWGSGLYRVIEKDGRDLKPL